MHHAKDPYIVASDVVDNHMVADGKAARAGHKVVAGAPNPWMAGQKIALFSERLAAPEAQEAFAAFMEKRKPHFSRFS